MTFFTSQFCIIKRLLLDSQKLCLAVLFLCKRDLHRIALCDFKALQCVSSSASLDLIIKLHKGDVVATGDQTHLLEPREPVQETTWSEFLMN